MGTTVWIASHIPYERRFTPVTIFLTLHSLSLNDYYVLKREACKSANRLLKPGRLYRH